MGQEDWDIIIHGLRVLVDYFQVTKPELEGQGQGKGKDSNAALVKA